MAGGVSKDGRPRRPVAGLGPRAGRPPASRITPQVYLFVLLFPVVVATLLAWFVEVDTPAARNPIQVVVSGDPGSPARELYSGVAGFAKEHHLAVALSAAEVSDPSRRVLYLDAPPGSGMEDWLSSGYQQVLFAAETRVVPFGELSTQGAAGKCLIYGAVSQTLSFSIFVHAFGYAGEVYDSSLAQVLLFKRSLLYSILGCWVLGVATLIASTFSKSRGYAVMRFWGNSIPIVFLRELGEVGRFLWPRLLAASVLATGAFGFFGRWQGVPQIGGIALPIVGVLLMATVLAHGVSLVMAYYLPDTLLAMRGRVQRFL